MNTTNSQMDLLNCFEAKMIQKQEKSWFNKLKKAKHFCFDFIFLIKRHMRHWFSPVLDSFYKNILDFVHITFWAQCLMHMAFVPIEFYQQRAYQKHTLPGYVNISFFSHMEKLWTMLFNTTRFYQKWGILFYTMEVNCRNMQPHRDRVTYVWMIHSVAPLKVYVEPKYSVNSALIVTYMCINTVVNCSCSLQTQGKNGLGMGIKCGRVPFANSLGWYMCYRERNRKTETADCSADLP